MDEIVKSIINLDNETNIMKEKYYCLIENKGEELRLKLLELEKKFSNESKIEISNMLHEVLGNSTGDLDTSLDDNLVEDMNKMENTYANIKSSLVEDVWRKLFLSEE